MKNFFHFPNFFQLPRDAGQIVDVSYSVDWENNLLYRKIVDRSDNQTTLDFADIVEGVFEPWNNVLPKIQNWTMVS